MTSTWVRRRWPDAVFTVDGVLAGRAGSGGRFGGAEADRGQRVSHCPSGVELPVGTVVTLSEAVPSGTGPGVEWGAVTWSGEGLTVHDDGTASFTIGDGTAPRSPSPTRPPS